MANVLASVTLQALSARTPASVLQSPARAAPSQPGATMPIKSLTFVSSNEKNTARCAARWPRLRSCRHARRARPAGGFSRSIRPRSPDTKSAPGVRAPGRRCGLVEDTGLAIFAWNGYPGALIKWVLGAVGEQGLCRQLAAWTTAAPRPLSRCAWPRRARAAHLHRPDDRGHHLRAARRARLRLG